MVKHQKKQRILIERTFDPKEEVFTHRDDDGTFRHFPVGEMLRVAQKFAGRCDDIICTLIKLENRNIQHIKNNMGIEQARIDRLIDPFLHYPLLGILWPPENNTLTLIDGNHRAVKLHSMGEIEYRCFAFKHPFWEQFLLPLADKENLLRCDSGFAQYEKTLTALEVNYASANAK